MISRSSKAAVTADNFFMESLIWQLSTTEWLINYAKVHAPFDCHCPHHREQLDQCSDPKQSILTM